MKTSPKKMLSKVPVTILTGFLGSGKTTLLNHILTEKHGLKIAVIQNQFGEVGVDDKLLEQNVFAQEQTIQTMNGCVCCAAVRQDLSKIIKKWLIKQRRVFDAIIIETTGMADPAPVAQTFFADPQVDELTVLDAIITVVDAKHILQHIREERPEGTENESIEQIAFADRVILNKIDLVNPEQIKEVQAQIKAINQNAQIIKSEFSNVDPSLLLGIQAFSLIKVLKTNPTLNQVQKPHHQHHKQEEEHLHTQSHRVPHKHHSHDRSISSCGCTFAQPINLGKLKVWINELLQEKADTLYRYKGVINVIGVNEPYVFQGVHSLFTGSFVKNGWKVLQQRVTNFCFIGKNIDKEGLIDGFKSCIAQPLSFSVGDKVELKVSCGPHGWKQGTIISLWNRGYPYLVCLSNGDEIRCPQEHPSLIRLKKGLPKPSEKEQISTILKSI